MLSGYKKNFTKGTLKYWDSWPREVVEYTSLEIFMSWLDKALDNLIQGPEGWTRWSVEVPSNLDFFIILWLILELTSA